MKERREREIRTGIGRRMVEVKAVRDREELIHSAIRTHTYCINHRRRRREKKQYTSRNCVDRKKAERVHVKLVKLHIETYISETCSEAA